MTMGNFATLALVEESTFGTTPASALQYISVEDFNLSQDADSQRPEILTGDARPYPSRRLRQAGGASIRTILQYENTLLPMEGVFRNARGSAVSITGTGIAFSSVTDKVTDTGNQLAPVLAGDLVYVTGAGAGANANTWFGPVTAPAAGEFTVPDGQLTTVAAGGSVTIRTRRLIDGTTAKSYSAERKLTELTNNFKSEKGIRWRRGSWSWEQNGWVREEYEGMGRYPVHAGATIGNGSFTTAPTAPFMAGTQDFTRMYWSTDIATGNAAIATAWNFTIENTLEPIYGLGSQGLTNSKYGFMRPQLEVSIYRDDNSQDFFDACDSFATVYVWWTVADPAGGKMAFLLTAAKPESAPETLGGADSLVSGQVTLSGHDPAKDSDSDLVAAATGRQVAVFWVPA